MILKNKKLYYRKDGTTYSVRLITPNNANNIMNITQGGLRKGINIAYGGKTWCSLCKQYADSGFNYYNNGFHWTLVDLDPKVQIIFQRWTISDTEYIKITDIQLYYSSTESFLFFLSEENSSNTIGTYIDQLLPSTLGGTEYYHIESHLTLYNNNGKFYFTMINEKSNDKLLYRVPINDVFNITPGTKDTYVKDISLADHEDQFTISV